MLLDTQFITDHLKTMGAFEIDQENFLLILKKALKKERPLKTKRPASSR